MEGGAQWIEDQKLVLYRLNQVDGRLEDLEEHVVLMRIELAQRKVKAGLWGAVAGSVPALATAIVAAWT